MMRNICLIKIMKFWTGDEQFHHHPKVGGFESSDQCKDLVRENDRMECWTEATSLVVEHIDPGGRYWEVKGLDQWPAL